MPSITDYEAALSAFSGRRAVASYFARMEKVRQAPRCHHIKVDGIRCGSPALRARRLCYFHNRIRSRRKLSALPPLEDANSVQVAIMLVTRGILDQSLDLKTGALLLYALQTASANLKRVDFERTPWSMVRQMRLQDVDDEDEFLPDQEPRSPAPRAVARAANARMNV